MRKPVVVDTNVLLVANGAAPSHSNSCSLACASKLLEIRQTGQVVLDYGYEVLTEYAKNQPVKVQLGLGFQFWKWLLNTRNSAEHCSYVKITKTDDKGYREFPDHPGLANFDPSDRKFIAITVAHGSLPPIMQASDSKWVGWQIPLSECGITVDFLCPAEIKAKFRKKMGNG